MLASFVRGMVIGIVGGILLGLLILTLRELLTSL